MDEHEYVHMTEKLAQITYYYGRVRGGVLAISRFDDGSVDLVFTLHLFSVNSKLPRYMAKGVPDDILYEAMYKIWQFQESSAVP